MFFAHNSDSQYPDVKSEVEKWLKCILRDHGSDRKEVMRLAASHASRIASSYGLHDVVPGIFNAYPDLVVSWMYLGPQFSGGGCIGHQTIMLDS